MKLTPIYLTVFFIATQILWGCSAGNKQFDAHKKYAPEALRADAALAWQVYSLCHPSLTWYAPYDSVQQAFTQLQQGITDSLTEAQFRFRLGKAMAAIRCGHTTVRPSKQAAKQRQPLREPMFPLALKCWGNDSMVIMANAFGRDSLLKRGTIVTAIGNLSAAQILDSMVQFIPADGYQRGLRLQMVSNNFPAYFKMIFGLSNQYSIHFLDSTGKPQQALVGNYTPAARPSGRQGGRGRADSVRNPAPPPQGPMQQALPRYYRQRHLLVDTLNSLAWMELNTFSPARLNSFFRRSFRQLKKMKISKLAIDLRANGGGNIVNSTRLTRYLSTKPFRVCDTMAATSFKFPGKVKVEWGLFYRLQHWLVAKKMDDKRYHLRHYERHVFTPRKQNHFDGKVYIITGAQTFSASTLFIHPLQNQRNVTLVGEETGGGAAGNSSVHIPDVTLPNTGVRIRLPLYRIVLGNNTTPNGRGIMPDVEVPTSSLHLRNRQDPKLLKVYELVGAKQ